MLLNRRSFLTGAALLCARTAFGQAKALNLKITGLKTIVVNAAGVNWVFCKVQTNEGLTGLGEGSVTSKEATLAQAIAEHERFLLGKDPTDIELLWQQMFRTPRWRGGPILMSAISAVEIALWDILGKALGVPVYKLLGGAARRRIRMYLDVEGTPEGFLRAKQQGFTAAKTSGFVTADKSGVMRGSAVRDAIKRIEAVRKAVGDDFDIAIDAHGRLTPPMAIDFCTRVEALRPLFVEEPTQLEDLDELAHLRSNTKVPLATGERLFAKYGFGELCQRHLVDYVQPDVCHAGGILELKKIGVLAELHRIEMAPHNPQSEVSTLASLHVDATTPAATIQECTSHRDPWIADLFHGGAVKVKDGFAELPDRPGLGVDLDEKVAAQHPYKPVNRPSPTFGDGGPADY